MSYLWASKVQQLTPYIPGEQVNDSTFIKLNTNENPYPPSPKAIEAMQQAITQDLQKYPDPTAFKVRQAMANRLNLDPTEVFVGNGSDEVLAFAFSAFFEPGKTIKFPSISYSFYPVYSKYYNIPYEAVTLDHEFNIQARDYDRAEGGVIFPNPNAPTSRYLPLAPIEEILKNNADVVVIVDEAYIDFAEGPSAVTLINKYPNLLVIQTLSKSRALAGLRVGFAMGQAHLIEALIRVKDSFNSYPVDRVAQAGAQAAIEDEAYFQAQVLKIKTTRHQFMQALVKKGYEVLPSAANFIFVKKEELDAKAKYEELKLQKILVRHFDTEELGDYLRITIGTDEEMKKVLHYF